MIVGHYVFLKKNKDSFVFEFFKALHFKENIYNKKFHDIELFSHVIFFFNYFIPRLFLKTQNISNNNFKNSRI